MVYRKFWTSLASTSNVSYLHKALKYVAFDIVGYLSK